MFNNENLEKDHLELVRRLAKSPDEILLQLTPEKVDLWHMLTGMETEIGEIATTLKAHIIYNKELDLNNLIEEYGDLEFYMQGMRDILGIDRGETLHHNLQKLNTRYPTGYTDQNAIERLDKNDVDRIDLEGR